MIKNLAIRVVTLAVGLGALPSVLSVCPDGQIGIGFADNKGAAIRTNKCDVIARRETEGFQLTICGGYNNGASVQCNAGTATGLEPCLHVPQSNPNTAQTGDGTDWGNCRRASNETCDVWQVLFCCSRNGL
ncbi:hypothetical protein JB92DRAFT_2838809 [Gautieria morchelliformis]|nr:hypothetical protein JB92DRAFT_2838809 [Gautieria morchelliformis]